MPSPVPQPLAAALASVDNLPSLPTAALEVLRLTREEDTTLDDLARVISGDPALAAKLLRFSNSSLFNLGQEVTTLQRATLVLGMKSVQLMSLSFSLAGGLTGGPQESVEGGFDYEMFWRRSVAAAVAGRVLTGLQGSLAEDEAFLCGLLVHIGQLVMAQCFDDYDEVLRRTRAAGHAWPRAETEREVLGFDHQDVGSALLASWMLPPLITVSVGHAHRPDDLPEDAPEAAPEIVRVLHVTALAVEVLCGHGTGEDLERLEREARERLGFAPEQIETFLLTLEGAFREAAGLLELPMPTNRSHEDILAEARSQMLQVGMKTAEELQEVRRAGGPPTRREVPDSPDHRDPDTGLVNSRGLEQFLAAQIEARMAPGVPRALGLLYVEVDQFDGLQDILGAEAAREAQRLVAAVLERITRRDDLAALAGKTRFAVVAPHCTPFGLRTLAERIRSGVEAASLSVEGEQVRLVVSVGGACLAEATGPRDAGALSAVVERYLDKARSAGGNRCELHGSPVHTRR